MRFQMTTLLIALLLSTSIATAQPPAKPLDPDVAALVKGNNEFAFDLYRQLSKKEGNIFFSPLSISTAMAMMYAGARGETAKDMAKVLRFPADHEKLHPIYARMLREKPDSISIANALWAQDGLSLNPGYLATCEKNYNAPFRNLNFAGDTEGARREINKWVSHATRDKIPEMFLPDILKKDTRFVFANAVYFKGTWQIPFPKDQTRDEDFFVSEGKSIKTPMMKLRKQTFNVSYVDGLSMLEMNYQEKKTSMILLLPHKRFALDTEMQKLTEEKFTHAVAKLVSQKNMEVYAPRFKFETTAFLSENLKSLGMQSVFPGDFSGIGGIGNLVDVLHKAYVEVDEVGTTAAAATAGWTNVSFPPVFITTVRLYVE